MNIIAPNGGTNLYNYTAQDREREMKASAIFVKENDSARGIDHLSLSQHLTIGDDRVDFCGIFAGVAEASIWVEKQKTQSSLQRVIEESEIAYTAICRANIESTKVFTALIKIFNEPCVVENEMSLQSEKQSTLAKIQNIIAESRKAYTALIQADIELGNAFAALHRAKESKNQVLTLPISLTDELPYKNDLTN